MLRSPSPLQSLILAGLVLALIVAITSGGQKSKPENETRTQNAAQAEVPVGMQPAPHSLGDAAAKFKVPEGFKVELFAGEPDVKQPISFTMDARGRLWVVECFSYPNWEMEGQPASDRIIILEDTDQDGKSDKRTVFFDKGTNFAGIELGFGGVWVCATPNLLFIPDADQDDQPDGPPVVKLDGWDLKAKHNVFNALTWGPDGWLYGCNGILSNSRVGKPGTPDAERVALNCGVWRYHPTQETFQWVASGTTNPWGLDFDDYGEMFITNCVIPHIFHVTPGAHFIRMFGEDLNPYSYGLIESCADHIHWGGGKWTDSRGGKGKHSDAGGGHAHVGAMVYLGDNWPKEYRGSVLMCNVHGNRLNRDFLERKGSGYVAKHGPDIMATSDEWFRGLEMLYGPDGSVFVTDWSDTGECHEFDEHGAHHDSGRIYKVSYKDPKQSVTDLARLSSDELVKLQGHANDWYVRQARLVLQMRAAAGDDMAAVHAALQEKLQKEESVPRRLRALWALSVTGGLDAPALVALLDDDNENLRGWAIRLLVDLAPPAPEVRSRLANLAKSDPSPYVRLQLASALQRIPVADRWEIATALIGHAEDSEDQNLPLMVWYGIEPLVPADKTRALQLVARCKIPLVRQHLARRLASL